MSFYQIFFFSFFFVSFSSIDPGMNARLTEFLFTKSTFSRITCHTRAACKAHRVSKYSAFNWTERTEHQTSDNDVTNLLTFFEDQLSVLIWSVTAQVFLDVSVFMVVYSNTVITRCFSKPLNQAGFTNWCLSLNQHWQFSKKAMSTKQLSFLHRANLNQIQESKLSTII